MSVYEVLPRFFVGGAIIASIPWFSQRFSPGVAGIVAVLPIVTLTSFISLALAQGTASVHSAVPKSFWGTFALYPYLGVMWFLLARSKYLVDTVDRYVGLGGGCRCGVHIRPYMTRNAVDLPLRTLETEVPARLLHLGEVGGSSPPAPTFTSASMSSQSASADPHNFGVGDMGIPTLLLKLSQWRRLGSFPLRRHRLGLAMDEIEQLLSPDGGRPTAPVGSVAGCPQRCLVRADRQDQDHLLRARATCRAGAAHCGSGHLDELAREVLGTRSAPHLFLQNLRD